METYILEEFLLQKISIISFVVFMIPFAIKEILNKLKKRKIDFFSKYKYKKIALKAYPNFYAKNPQTAKQETAEFLREIYKNNLLNEKYDLLKRRA